MQFFTQENLEEIRERMEKRPALVKKLSDSIAPVEKKLMIQKSGLATWSHYFSCPKCGTALSFDYDNNESFTCPGCSETVSGEPYLGAWWNRVLNITTSSAFKAALLSLLPGQEHRLELAKKILLGYADNYKNYEVHGGIPYNKPGRFASQVLSDAHPISELTYAYGILKPSFTEAERRHIEEDLFRAASEHQIANMTPQLHNHEVIVATSIAMIGIAIDDPSLVEFALNTKYGLKYQVKHSFLEDGLWFEGATGYHLYSLSWFMQFDSAARNTPYSLLDDPECREILLRALKYPKNLYLGNAKTVALNDGGGSLFGVENIYEHAYRKLRDPELLPYLKTSFGENHTRDCSVNSLIFGVDSLPDNIPDIEKKTTFTTVGSQHALIRRKDDGYLFFKAFPYGGEHDHYDRLGIAFDAFGLGIGADLGTSSGYGSPLHYGYYKNTASHNTVNIDGENMAPADTRVNEYSLNSKYGCIYLDAETLPPEDYKMLDSFTIKQWSDEAYKGVRMRRRLLVEEDYFIDIFDVFSDNELPKNYTLHLNMRLIDPKGGRYVNGISNKGALSYIKNAYIDSPKGVERLHYEKDGVSLDVHTLADGIELVKAEGPGKPADRKLAYLIERTSQKCHTFLNLIEIYKGAPAVSSVYYETSAKGIIIKVTLAGGGVKSYELPLAF